MTNSINPIFSRPYVPAPTQEQIDQLKFLNKQENQHLLAEFVREQQAGHNPTLPKPPQTDPNPYTFTMTRTLTSQQRNILINCLNSPSFSFIILGLSQIGSFLAHLIKITFVAPDYSYFSGWWYDPSDGIVKFVTFAERFTWGIQC
ncbi:hypothetical protein [Bacillus aerius]|uniref:hypothetical protein n=1 Tax=Bacillus aerius TaxID=293388 RepID=UPI0034510E57